MSKSSSEIAISIHSILDLEEDLQSFFQAILNDYCKRYKVKVKGGDYSINITFVEASPIHGHGVTIKRDNCNKILVQVRDPYLSGWEPNAYTMYHFINVVAHEMVHVCQYLTGRQGMIADQGKRQGSKKVENYFFDPDEVEARLLQDLYVCLYGQKFLNYD